MTGVLEDALQVIPAASEITAITSQGETQIHLSFGRSGREALQIAEVQDRLALLRRSLPRPVLLSVTQARPEAFEVAEQLAVLELSGDLPLGEVGDRVANALLSVREIQAVAIDGGVRPELLIEPMPNTSLQTFSSWVDLIGSMMHREYGLLQQYAGHSVLFRSARWHLLDRKTAAVKVEGAYPIVRLDELGRMRVQGSPVRSIGRIDQRPVITLTIYRGPGSHLLRSAREMHQAVVEIRKTLPLGSELRVAFDRSQGVREQIRGITARGGLGLVLMVLVLVLSLRSWRGVAIVLFAVVVSLSCAIILFKPLGLTLNVLTIAGLALLFGLLVDNAVVVVERLQAELGRPGSECTRGYFEASRRAIRGVWLPLLGGTLSTCAVFLPMVYLSGELQGLFSSFAVLAALTLGFSLIVSLVLIPRLDTPLRSKAVRRAGAASQVGRLYLLPFRFAGRHPGLTFLLLALAIGLPTPLLPEFIEEPPEGWLKRDEALFAARYNRFLGSDTSRDARLWLDPFLGGVTGLFLKNVELGKRWDFEEKPEVRVWIQLAPGSGIGRTDEQVRPFEEEARRSPAVERTLVKVRDRVATMRVLFHEEAMQTDEPYLLRERLISHALQVAGLEVSVSGLVPMGFYSGLGQVTDFTVHAYGPSYERLEEISSDFARRLSHYPRVADVDINAGGQRSAPAREVIRFHWGSDATAQTGLTTRQLAEILRPRLWHETPDFHADLEGDPRMPVRIVTEGAEDLQLATLLDMPLTTGAGGTVRLADHAELSIEKDPPVIERFDQQYRRMIGVQYRGPHRMGKEMLDKELAWMRLPPGYRLERPRYEFFSTEVQREFFWLLLGTLALVFLVIAAVLESWRLAAVVMLSVPLAWIGVALGFLLTGQNFAEGAFIGGVLTVGIAVNDSILLLDAYRRFRLTRTTAPPLPLALLALRRRLRPMWTTTLTSIASMLPLLVLPDAGNFWVGLAVTVVGGLLASTLLAPVATVGLLAWMDRPSLRVPNVDDLVDLRSPQTVAPN